MPRPGFGPWRPEWTFTRMPGLGMPFLGVLAGQQEPMGWGTMPQDIQRGMPMGGRLEVLTDSGHFVHIENPTFIAEMLIDFLERGK